MCLLKFFIIIVIIIISVLVDHRAVKPKLWDEADDDVCDDDGDDDDGDDDDDVSEHWKSVRSWT